VESCACGSGQVCCRMATGDGTCAKECVSGATCPLVACAEPPPDAGADSADATDSQAAVDPGGCPETFACTSCGAPCSPPGLNCYPIITGQCVPFPTNIVCVTNAGGTSPHWLCSSAADTSDSGGCPVGYIDCGRHGCIMGPGCPPE
jgi:hypothetical protein